MISAVRPHSKRSLRPLGEGGYLGRHTVCGKHYLASGLVEHVESVEELLLGMGLSGDELDVVDQQYVDVAVSALELGGPVLPEGGNELDGEGLGTGESDGQAPERCGCR